MIRTFCGNLEQNAQYLANGKMILTLIHNANIQLFFIFIQGANDVINSVVEVL